MRKNTLIIISIVTIYLFIQNRLNAGQKDISQEVPQLINDLEKATGYKKEDLIMELSKSNDSRAVQPLVDILLNDADDGYKIIAASSLRNMTEYSKRNKDLKTALVKYAVTVFKQILNSNDDNLKSNCAIALYNIDPGQESINHLDKLAKAGSTAAIFAFSYVDKTGKLIWDQNAKGICNKAISYENDEVKSAAAICLYYVGEKEVAYNVSKSILRNSKNYRAKNQALFTLEEIGDENSLSAIEAALDDSDKEIRKTSRRILYEMKQENRIKKHDKNK